MSLILEALKKSEQQRRLGEAPNLGTPVLTTRRRRSALPLLALLIVVALGVGWWVLRAGNVPAPDADKVAVAPSQAPPAENQESASKSAPPAAPALSRRPVPAGKDQSQSQPVNNRAEVGNQPLPIAPNPVDRPGSVADAPSANPLTGGPRNVPPPAATAPARRPQPSRVDPNDKVQVTPTAPAAVPVTPPSAPPLPASPPAAAKATLPTVWELPYATRKDLPDLHLTMHVYADDPAERFVVIGGERHTEGDDLGDNVILREIRPDGLVLDLNGKRFLYPRDGR